MTQNKIKQIIGAIALALMLTTGAGIVADELGIEGGAQVHACGNPSISGGGC